MTDGGSEGSTGASRSIARLVHGAPVLLASATFGWLLSALLVVLEVRALPGALPVVFMASTLSLAALLVAALATLSCAFLPRRWFDARPLRLGPRELALLAFVGFFAALAALVLPPLFVPLVPRSLSYPEHVACVVAAYAGALAACVSAWLVTKTLAREVSFSSLCWLCALVVARVFARPHVTEVIGAHGASYELAFVVSASLGFFALSRALPRSIRAGACALTFAAVSCLFALLGDRASERAAYFKTYTEVGRLLVRVALLFDYDRDGNPAVLGGADCDDFDETVGPGAIEVVGNGKDDNCSGGELASASDPPPLVRLEKPPSRNLIIVTLDAARADLLSPRTMPRLFEHAARYAVFERAYANSNHTTASVLSMSTGQLPMGAQLGFNGWAGAEPPLAGLFDSVGYHTLFGFQAHFSGTGRWVCEDGFAEVDRELVKYALEDRGVLSTRTTERAIEHVKRLEAAGKPYFAWFHYLDMHEEYMHREGTPFSGSDTPSQRYLQEAWSVDRDLGRLLDYLEASRFFARDGVLVVHSDHGEIAEDGGRTGHAFWIDEGVLRVLLLVRGPTVKPGRYRTRVNLVDVYPTVLELAAGIGAPSMGRNLKRVWTGSGTGDGPVFGASFYADSHLAFAIVDRYKYVRDLRLGASYLYDLERDPGETQNLAAQEPELVKELSGRLGRVWDVSMNDRVLMRRARGR